MSDGRTRFGCIVMQNEPLSVLKSHWRAIEDAGFDSLWVADHLMTFPKMGVLLEAWTTLAAMAVSTSRVRIGTLVTNITYRNPALLARQAIAIDHLSQGRIDVGLGAAGSRPDDSRIAGMDEWSLAERASRFEEFVDIVEGLLSGRIDAYEGRHYRTAAFGRGSWPVQSPRPPILIAAHGARTLRVAARFADTWNGLAGYGGKGAGLFGFLRECNARLDELAHEAGRRPGDIRRSVLVHQTGLAWWESEDALRDFLGKLDEAGVQDVIFYYPPHGEGGRNLDEPRFLDLMGRVLDAA